ncbi:MAG: hypothetical protein JXA77_00435 [Bacteroidales bacterium]|nr:hypothetical protein [Bacteroidales bacterium]MBN2817640.1 hypothetical protein [Bacteroidales bacterium]
MAFKLNKTINGKSLYLVVFLSFIILVLLWMFLTQSMYARVEAQQYVQLKHIVDRNNNLIYKLLNGSENQTDSIDDLIKTQKVIEDWGAFKVVNIKSDWKSISYTKTALAGNYIFQDDTVGLFLADKEKAISVSGQTKIYGTCFIPSMGIKSIYVDGSPYRNDRLLYGEKRTSKKNLPELSSDLLNWINKSYGGDFGINDSIINKNHLFKDNIIRSYRDKALVIFDKDKLVLRDVYLKGKIIVQSDSLIIIRKSSVLEGIIVVSPKIIVEKGFEGNLQLFASDSILIESDVKLNYPSFVSVHSEKSKKGFCYIDENSRVEGGVLCAADVESGSKSAELFLAENSTVCGIVYCQGSISMNGNVLGSVYTNQFHLKTRKGYYENVLNDAEINPLKLTPTFLVPKILESKTEWGVLEWLD